MKTALAIEMGGGGGGGSLLLSCALAHVMKILHCMFEFTLLTWSLDSGSEINLNSAKQ